MKIMFGLSQRNIFSLPPFLENKVLAGFVVACILFNGLVPRFTLGQKDRDTLSRIMASQSVLLHFFSLSTLPEKIVSDLFMAQNPLTAKDRQQPKNNTDDRANSSSDFSILAFDKKLNFTRYEYQRINGPNRDVPVNISPQSLSVLREAFKPPALGSFVYLLVLMFFFLLPRSSVGEYAIKVAFNSGMKPNLFPKLGFLFGLNEAFGGDYEL